LALALSVSRLLTVGVVVAAVGFCLAQIATFHAAAQQEPTVGVWTGAFAWLGLRLSSAIGLWALRLWIPEFMRQRADRQFFLSRTDAHREVENLLPR
jgi:hypothetical protein